MDKKLIDEIVKKIEEYKEIAIYRHVMPDPDSYGSSNGLKDIILNSFKDKKVYLMGEHSERLSYIGETDNVKLKDPKKTLAIVLDVSNAERVDDQSFLDCDYIIKIDHHKPFTEPFENLTFVDTNYSSCSEMILDIVLNSTKELKLSKKGREALYAGIIGDTGRLLYLDNPTSLLEKLPKITFDIEAKPIYRNMYKKKKEELQILGYIYGNFKITQNGVAYLKVPYETVKEFNLEPIQVARMVNSLADLENIKNWVFFAEKENGEIFGEFRSNGPVVNDIAFKYGGGGHALAAGATIKDWDTVSKMLEDFDTNCKNN